MNNSSLNLSVYLITRDDPDMPGIVGSAISAGAGLIQYKHKGQVEGATLDMAREVRKLCSDSGVPFVVNDSVELARILEADVWPQA